jgi:hypothetical protein
MLLSLLTFDLGIISHLFKQRVLDFLESGLKRESAADLFPKPPVFFPLSFSQNQMRFQPINSVHPLEIIPCHQFQSFIAILRLKVPRARMPSSGSPLGSETPYFFSGSSFINYVVDLQLIEF